MGLTDRLLFKIADQPWEFEEIHKLNYRTFVEEIPQHEPNKEKKLVDKFHNENTYIICLDGEKLVGMIAYRDKRPFSLDFKIENLDQYIPQGLSVCEVRLLAVDQAYRHTRVSQLLLLKLIQYAIDQGSEVAVISGALSQVKLYEHLGFVPFGEVVRSGDAFYQPMYLTIQKFEELRKRSRAFTKTNPELSDASILFNFLPGPVDFSKYVHDVFSELPRSHRSDDFVADFQKTRERLCKLVNAKQVEILMGPGTLANDAIAGQLSLLSGVGAILVNGEFGRRLIKHARGAKLLFRELEVPEGQTFSRKDVEQFLDKNKDITWLWATHCETSTGVLNDIEELREICNERNIKLCLDCISSIGTVPIDLSGVYLASGTSGKGLASIAGLAMVFHNHDLEPAPDDLPRCLDLGLYQKENGIPFTVQSYLVYALFTAMKTQDWEKRYQDIRDWSISIRRKLSGIDAPILAPDSCASPAVVTIVLPEKYSSRAIGDTLKKHGVLVSYASSYLLERNWIQVCMMGAENKPPNKFIRLLKQEMGK